MFTSVTKKSNQKAIWSYFFITLFLMAFPLVYEHYSYGEYSWYMRSMFIAPLLAFLIMGLTYFNLTWVKSRLSLNLLNSAVAIFVSAGLIKGIIEVSGRTTTVDALYWPIGLAFVGLSLLTGLYSLVHR